MTKIGKLITVTALIFSLLATPASAHSSSYCGHGSSGILTITQYTSSYGDSFAHYHRRRHSTTYWGPFGSVISVHHDTKVCAVPTQGGHF